MTDNEFDDIIKNRLHQHESQVPADMWQRIVGDKKKRRFGFFLNRYAGILILLLFAGGGFLLFYSEQNKKENNIHVAASGKTEKLNDSVRNTQKIITPIISSAKNNPINFIAAIKNKSERSFLPNNIISQQQQNNAENNNNDNSNSQRESLNESNQKNQNNSSNTITQQKATKQSITDDDTTTITAGQNENSDKISISIFASPDLALSKISSADAQYQNLLQNSIKMKLSYTLGVRVNYHLNKRISLSTGVQYSRVNETFSFDDSTASTHNNWHNHLDFINIPFAVTYNTNWTNYFQTSINAGILLNILSNYKGKMPDKFGGSMDVGKSVYKNNVGVSFYTGVSFTRSISNKFAVFAEPYFRYQSKNIANNQQSFTRKINTAGIELGIRYNLFKKEKEQ